jgi:5-methyltetrahydrofolate--homocysteine methyltransferase
LTEKTLAEALADFDRDVVLAQVKNRLDGGEDPIGVVQELQEGMKTVGDRFSSGDYFLSELMMSADLFMQAMKLIEPKLEGMSQETIGKIVVGTPKGDIHDLGKNIFMTVAKGAGFEVHDLGVDVPVSRFLEAVEEVNPDILGFSALITSAFEPMKEVVDSLKEKGLRDKIKVIVGGGVTTKKVLEHVGADAQTIDAVEGIHMCRGFVGL